MKKKQGHQSFADLAVSRRNGKNRKKVRTAQGEVEITTPWDRNSSFKPQMVRKRQRSLGEGLDNKVLSLYAKGFI